MKMLGSGAEGILENRTYRLRQRGFWKSVVEWTDQNRQVVFRVEQVNWHGFKYQFTWQGLQHELIIRNAPLAEYAITRNGRDVLAYGLKPHGNGVLTAITSSEEHEPQHLYEFHLLLWFLFSAIAEGETGEGKADDFFLSQAAS